ncbi:MAG: hypothetical protein BWY64_04070 [bacterium ADurb.Bin363]|nr:MAG: hypothetical protein BWY64_04070 [bacterium ADurb.Bin363]
MSVTVEESFSRPEVFLYISSTDFFAFLFLISPSAHMALTLTLEDLSLRDSMSLSTASSALIIPSITAA